MWLVLACSSPSDLDRVAEDYVRLVLAVGELEPGYVDAYYGPERLREQVRAEPRTVPELVGEADRLLVAVGSAEVPPAEVRRAAFLKAHLYAVRYRLAHPKGSAPPFAEEAEALFGVRPELPPLASFEPSLARVEALLPGEGPLADRVAAFERRLEVPPDKVRAVMEAGIAACRGSTAEHLDLPSGERFRLELVTGQSWSGYNWYQGGLESLIQVNTDLPVLVDRAVDLGCHEGYPGHHTHNTLLEHTLVDGRGWVEFTVQPLYSPLALVAEGAGNHGVELAFGPGERLTFEREVLFPLAGLDPALAATNDALRTARRDLSLARIVVAAEYLDGRLDRPGAVAALRRTQLLSPERAEQVVSFFDDYRSYVVNYGLGEQRVRAAVQAAGSEEQARWEALRGILSEPTLPADL